MKGDTEHLSIGGCAKAAGVTVETIRFYQQKGLLPEPPRPRGTIRRYGTADLARLKFVKAAKRLGFSLDEIGQLLSLEDGTHCDDARVLAERKLRDVRQRLAALRAIEAVLAGLVVDCCAAAATRAGAAGSISCPLIASLQHAE